VWSQLQRHSAILNTQHEDTNANDFSSIDLVDLDLHTCKMNTKTMPAPRHLAACALASTRPSPVVRRCDLPRSVAYVGRSRKSCHAYHSYDHPPPPGPFSHAEKAILAAAYKHVPELGFSQKALVVGAKESGHLDISASLLPDGPFSLALYHLVTRRESLAERNAQIFGGEDGGAKAGISTRVERLTWERLLANRDVIHKWQDVRAPLAKSIDSIFRRLRANYRGDRLSPSWHNHATFRRR
jgi:hypothetical protein